VRVENAMVSALLAEARPTALEGERLTVTFPSGSTFSKKKAESNRGLLHDALRGLTGHSLVLVHELGEDNGDAEGAAPRTLSEEELLERLVREFGAKEVFEELDADPTPKD
jgi:hypothetical protein